ncbi:predicted protein [Aspergillus nidulans FGSC A4]|uniref:Uncharacterized protein n=1 Tax=Emericella nidulans (strain FGSC A4 / ATCC 38163 / CBS 112.46 / NRRL 194 / M139) TaxID=227321 RepID=Q5BAI2_EMENI|nr:hypothetical protein [Aspergillus nidulans FGSC A4]EAA64154.1 predicted protein [Aspergillus nidulans FGSC A4]CBF86873.1 TPA: conserved hypothetical protein [Aspergillus nidulans FGSC A4]|eukprot:XP_660052.1 predicted protein [Aspergillus nidulans FGSC A4]
MASVSENTPLLAESEPRETNEYQISQDHSVTTAPAKPYYRTIVVLTHLSAALSVPAFVLYLTVSSIDIAGPGGFYLSWDLATRIHSLAITSILSFLASALNLARLRHARRPLWLWLNLPIDAAIAFSSLVLVPGALALNFNQSPDSWLPDRGAAATARAVIVFLANSNLLAASVEGIIQQTSTPTPIPGALTAMIEETKKEEDQNPAPPSSVIRPEKRQ